jgi:ParB-like nuclease domain
MVRPSHDPFVEEQSLHHQLQRISRRRRKDLSELLPQLELVSIRPDDLNLPTRKTRKCTPAHVREVMGAISELGFCAPILVGKDNLVLDGEVRVEAAKALGLPAVPCIRIDHLTDVEQRTLRLVVNRLSEKGECANLAALCSARRSLCRAILSYAIA